MCCSDDGGCDTLVSNSVSDTSSNLARDKTCESRGRKHTAAGAVLAPLHTHHVEFATSPNKYTGPADAKLALMTSG